MPRPRSSSSMFSNTMDCHGLATVSDRGPHFTSDFLARFVASSVACYMAMSNSPEAGEDFVYTKRVVLVSLDVHSNPIHASTTTYITRAYQNSKPRKGHHRSIFFHFLTNQIVPLSFPYMPCQYHIHSKSMPELQV